MALLELEKLRKDINILFKYVKCLLAKSDENCPLVATEWSANHINSTGNPYIAGTYVFYNGHVYKCLFNNESILPTNTTYWLDLGEGHLLAEEQSDWNATGGRRFIVNKPTNTSDFINNGEDGSSPYATLNDLTNSLQNLDEVLTEGNVSQIDAKVGGIYLYNDNVLSGLGYPYITGNKNRFNFYNNADVYYANIAQDRLVLIDTVVPTRQFSIQKPASIGANRTATFQDASGTVAYLSDISIPTLDEVLNEGNVSLLDASIGSLYLYNPNALSGNGYVSITGNKNRVNFFDNNGTALGYINQDTLLLEDLSTAFGFQIKKPSTLGASRTATFQDASGTVAYLSDIPSTLTYGLYSQTADSSFITGLTEGSLIGAGIGTLTVPPNTFQIGDTFHLKIAGKISNDNNAQLVIKIKSGLNVLVQMGPITLPSTTNKNWELTTDFNIRTLGIAGTASLQTNGKFIFNKNSSNAFEGQAFDYLENTIFDTTIINTLDITANWLTLDPINTIHSHQLTLTKTY